MAYYPQLPVRKLDYPRAHVAAEAILYHVTRPRPTLWFCLLVDVSSASGTMWSEWIMLTADDLKFTVTVQICYSQRVR